MSKEEGDDKKSADSDGYDASNTRDGRWHEKWIFRHGCRMFWHGSLDGISLMEQGGVHARTWPYYFTRISVPQKMWETSYLSVRVRPQGNKEHPITQVTDPKKAGGVIGGVTDDGAMLDC